MEKISFKNLKAKIGHSTLSKSKTGCTAILFDNPSVCGVHISGGAPGSRETELLDPSCLVDKVNGLLLTGGSAFGLATADGAMKFCEKNGIGFAVGKDRIPIIPSAVIYDRGTGTISAPTSKNGFDACLKADYLADRSGNIGGGAGATVGKWSKRLAPSPGGIGTAIRKFGNVSIGAVVITNSFGNIIDPKTGQTVEGARDAKGNLVNFNSSKTTGKVMGNTIIGAIITDAALSKADAKRLAVMASAAIAKTTDPSHTIFDGDTFFAVSTGKKSSDLNALGIRAAEVAIEAILNSVTAMR